MANKFKIGTIVVVMEGSAFGNNPGDITKILSKPGTVDDRTARLTNIRHKAALLEMYILCERVSNNKRVSYSGFYKSFYLNKPCTYELISDLRLATKDEKVMYRKSKNKWK